ncbi:MAG: hypothetical protein ABIA75_06440 [Candidatus Neomarinimicrobiota bacterium]
MLPEIKTVLKPRPRKYRNIARHLSPLLLTREDSGDGFSEADIFNDLSGSRGTGRFLGLFSKLGIQFALKKFGVLQALENLGLTQPTIYLDTTDSYKHLLRIVHQSAEDTIVSGEIVARRGHFNLPPLSGIRTAPRGSDLIIIEWLLLQHPQKPFTRFRPQLPGQEFPGLGIGRLVYETLYWAARRGNADGILIVPNYLHTGLFYGRQFLFVDPAQQGLIHYIEKQLLLRHRLERLTWACTEGQIRDRNTRQVFHWQPAPMIMPVSLKIKDYFSSPEYSRRVQENRQRFRLSVKSGYRKHFDKSWQVASYE